MMEILSAGLSMLYLFLVMTLVTVVVLGIVTTIIVFIWAMFRRWKFTRIRGR